jgi:hypothetical protein
MLTQASFGPGHRRVRRFARSTLLFAAAVPIAVIGGHFGLRNSVHGAGQSTNAHADARGALLEIDTKHIRNELGRGAIGLSIEAKELATQDLSAGRGSLVALMRLLGPGVLRIGGSSLDSSWWTAGAESPPAWATSVVTPQDLTRLRDLLVATGWRAILGVDLGHSDSARAANEVRAATTILGKTVIGFEIGNEPSNYSTSVVGLRKGPYSANDYLNEIYAYEVAMRAAVPTVRFYGPDVVLSQAQSWLQSVASNWGAYFNTINFHFYPTKYSYAKGACKETPMPTAGELLSPTVREGEDAALQTMLQAGELAQRPIRLSETNNTASCDLPGGPATSPVYASALWALDWSLRAASAGVVGLNFHGYLGRCRPESFAPMCEPSSLPAASGRVAARPEYYGLLAARQLEGGRFVQTRVISSRGLPNLTAWATVSHAGTLKIAIENVTSQGLAQPVSIPVSGYRGTYERLAGPSIEAKGGVTFGGAAVTEGRWRPRPTRLSCTGGSCRVTVRPASATIITLRPKGLRRHRRR